MPSPITLSRFVFLAFLASHGCVFGYDEVGDNHRVVHGSIRGTNAAMVKPVKPMITKLVHPVAGNELVHIQRKISSGESYKDMKDGIHDRRLEVWTQRGFDIDGEAAADGFGSSVSVSYDGRIIAIGAPLNDAGVVNVNNNRGHVRVYSWNNTNYVQRGADINGEAANDRFGTSVSISYDGNTFAAGAPRNNGIAINNTNTGHVRVFTWNNSHYVQRGSDIDGEADFDFSGTSISISGDGLVLAIGAPSNDGNGTNSGHVRVYIWNGTAHVQRGIDIDGEAANDLFGTSVSLSYAGDVLAVGAPFNDPGGNNNRGHVRVFTWNNSHYVQRGSDIDGVAHP
ncbi:hypothetical protein ACHAW5_000031 [Stephanodiscus triporus]|uniref:Uncharacterized protein n=1 Tax=Stephanodiscus triporus TaxID=2934178 RepID=A0ABD3PS67_9STRA